MTRPSTLMALSGCCVLAGASAAMAGPGADVIVAALPDIGRYGSNGAAGTLGPISAYSVGTTSCNISTTGTALLWLNQGTSNLHPVIGTNMYRLKNGRFEQIGQSWLKHGFTTVNNGICGTCDGRLGTHLGIGCSDPYSASLNGQQSNLGPRSQVNATTGVFPYPFSAPAATAIIGRRLQVMSADLVPAENPGALYWVDGQYVAPDDAQFNNGLNNMSYRRILVGSLQNTSGAGQSYALSFSGATIQQQPAINAWQVQDPAVVLVNAGYQETAMDTVPTISGTQEVTIDVQFRVGGRAYDNGDGTWTYQYAVYNPNSDRSAGSITVPTQCGVQATNIGFQAPFSHSGEPYSNTAWSAVESSGSHITWSTESHAANPNANALRWGTMYTYRFTANAAPVSGDMTIGLFKPATVNSPATSIVASGLPVPGPATSAGCRANWDGVGGVNSGDVTAFLNGWFNDLASGTLSTDFNCSGTVNSGDVTEFLNAWFAALLSGC